MSVPPALYDMPEEAVLIAACDVPEAKARTVVAELSNFTIAILLSSALGPMLNLEARFGTKLRISLKGVDPI
eukprot:Nk52_evm1s2534 gene=Nk52_evmTU1s2534